MKGIYLTTSADVLLETANKDAGKGPALRELAKMLRIDREEIAAFGNAENDIDMIRFAGQGSLWRTRQKKSGPRRTR